MARQDGIPKTLLLEVVTPTRMVVREDVDEVVVPGSQGYFGVLGGHLPFMSTLKIGELAYRKNGRWRYLALRWGYVEVLPETVIVLAETAERAEEIDVARAERARDRALEQMTRWGEEGVDISEVEAALAGAMTRIEVATRA